MILNPFYHFFILAPAPKDKTGIVLEIHPNENYKAGNLGPSNKPQNQRLADFSYNVLSQFGPYRYNSANTSPQKQKSIAKQQHNLPVFRKPPKDTNLPVKPSKSNQIQTKLVVVPPQTKQQKTKQQQAKQNTEEETTPQYNPWSAGMFDDDYPYYNYLMSDMMGGASGGASQEVGRQSMRRTDLQRQRVQNNAASGGQSNDIERCGCMFWCPVGFEYRGACQSNLTFLFGMPMSRCCLRPSKLQFAQQNANRNSRHQRMIWDD